MNTESLAHSAKVKITSFDPEQKSNEIKESIQNHTTIELTESPIFIENLTAKEGAEGFSSAIKRMLRR